VETQEVKATRSPWMIVALAAVVGVLIGAIAVVVLWPGESSAKAVTLEPADQAGDDPFTESVQTGEVPVIEQPAVEAASAVRDDLPRDNSTALLVATGTAPGLYGGSGDAQVCDPEKLVAFLDEHQDKAQAFAGVLGIVPEGIGDYVATLTPVVLISDTLVTNHGFENGHATALTSVLQAGTAVMVDQQGVPRVKCNCGNPLTEPKVVPTDEWSVRGDAWDDFERASVTGIVAGDTVDEFTVCHLGTGRTYTQPVGWNPSGGTAPPKIDGDYTIELRSGYDLMTPLAPGSLDPRICPTASLEGAVLSIRGTRATIKGATGFGGDLVGIVEGVPAGMPDYLEQIQRATNGAVITLRPDGQDAPEVKLTVATTSTELAGTVSMTGAQDPSVRVSGCNAGLVATKDGAESILTPSTTSTSTSTTTVATFPPESIPGSAGQCSLSTIEAAIEDAIGEPIVGLSVLRCNERWAAVSYGVDEQDDAALLEWNGSTWVGGACATYGDPNNFMLHQPVVPDEFWLPCTVD
jgi:hypothetical protein